MSDNVTKLFVGNVPFDAQDDDLKDELGVLGLAPREVKVGLDRETGRGRGFAFVTFDTPQAAREALDIIGGHYMNGRQLRADYARERPKTGGGERGAGNWRDDWGTQDRRRK